MKRILVPLLLLCLCTLPLMSTIIIKPTDKEMVKISHAIIEGKVNNINYSMEEGNIFTEVQIKVLDDLKGSYRFGDTITLSFHGGVYGELKQVVHGQPQFFNNEKVFIFVEKVGSKNMIAAMSYGKYTLTSGMNPLAVRNLDDLTVMQRDKLKNLVHIEPFNFKKPIFLNDLKTRILNILEAK